LGSPASFTKLFSFQILAEKEKMALEHHDALEAQQSISAELKDQLIQAGLQHARALKEAIAAGDSKVEEARKEFADATAQLRKELEEETRQLQQALDRNAELTGQQAELDRMVRDADAQAPSKCLSFLIFFNLPSPVVYLKTVLSFSRVLSGLPGARAQEGHGAAGREPCSRSGSSLGRT
jgi:multidrug efflux pump subunit AcrA (membrane-fusion protein)